MVQFWFTKQKVGSQTKLICDPSFLLLTTFLQALFHLNQTADWWTIPKLFSLNGWTYFNHCFLLFMAFCSGLKCSKMNPRKSFKLLSHIKQPQLFGAESKLLSSCEQPTPSTQLFWRLLWTGESRGLNPGDHKPPQNLKSFWRLVAGLQFKINLRQRILS